MLLIVYMCSCEALASQKPHPEATLKGRSYMFFSAPLNVGADLQVSHFASSVQPMLQYVQMDKKIPPRLTESVTGAG